MAAMVEELLDERAEIDARDVGEIRLRWAFSKDGGTGKVWGLVVRSKKPRPVE
jgi:hypothetical protein